MRQLDNILTEIHWRNMEMWSTAIVKIRISVHFIYNYTCWFLLLWCNWLSLKMILPEVWGLCLSLMDEQSSSSFSRIWGRSRLEFLTFVLFGGIFFSVTVSSVLFSKIKFQGNVVASSECIQLLCSECTSHPAQLAEDVRFSLRSVPLLPAVTLAFLNLFAEQSNVSKSLCFMSCIITSVWMWDGDTSVRKTWTGLIWCHCSLLAAAVGHTTAFTAVLARWGVWGGVAEQKVIMANHISVIVLLCAMDHCFFLRGFKWKKWLRWEKKNLYLQFF